MPARASSTRWDRHGVFHRVRRTGHAGNRTPHIAVTVAAVLMFVIAAVSKNASSCDRCLRVRRHVRRIRLLAAYFFISIAAPMYLKKIGELTPKNTQCPLSPHPAAGARHRFRLYEPAPLTRRSSYFPYIFSATSPWVLICSLPQAPGAAGFQ